VSVVQESTDDVGRGIRLCYDQFGDPNDSPMLLIAGLGRQKHSWPAELADAIASHGYRVTRFDNRDVGLSTHMDFPAPNPLTIPRGGNNRRQYQLGDMARDTVGLLDALGCDDAHLVGISMGGMIAQTVAAHYPGRVRTLTSLMSTTGAPLIGRPALSTWWRLATSRPPRNRDKAIEASVPIFRHIGSHGFTFDESWISQRAGMDWDRDPTSDGVARQLAGIFASGDRTRELRAIDVPTLVIHGDRDRMVHPTGGDATAKAIPGARLETIPGMGHELPRPVWPRLVELITEHAAKELPRTRGAEESGERP
jgi:pimeloyl-ACP methyl ester carboxylesterase